jgi:hypothetical protein
MLPKITTVMLVVLVLAVGIAGATHAHDVSWVGQQISQNWYHSVVAISPLPATHRLADDILIGAQQIADELGIDIRKCFHWLESGHIPATKTGRTWTTTRQRLRKHFAGE